MFFLFFFLARSKQDTYTERIVNISPSPKRPSSVVLSVTNLRKDYGSLLAVSDVSFDVHRGEIVGLLGPNGAGKTTTVNMILGVLAPSMGTIRVEGYDVARCHRQAMELSNFAAVYAPLPGNLTVEQNLRIFGMLYGITNLQKRIEEVIAEFDLEEYREKKSGVLSSGEQTRLCLAKAMLNRPQLLLLDEPTASLDPSVARDIRTKIRNYAEAQTCGVLWTSHNMHEVSQVCDRVLFLSRGNVLLEGDPKTLHVKHGKSSLEELFITVAKEPLTLDLS